MGSIIKTFIKPNPNSGFFVLGGIGYLEHKIYIDVDNSRASYFSADNLTGYDKKTSGLMLSGMFGYMYLSNSRGLNLYIGIEAVTAFTKNVRAWDFVSNTQLNEKRIDIFFGPKFGIMAAIYIAPLCMSTGLSSRAQSLPQAGVRWVRIPCSETSG